MSQRGFKTLFIVIATIWILLVWGVVSLMTPDPISPEGSKGDSAAIHG